MNIYYNNEIIDKCVINKYNPQTMDIADVEIQIQVGGAKEGQSFVLKI